MFFFVLTALILIAAVVVFVGGRIAKAEAASTNSQSMGGFVSIAAVVGAVVLLFGVTACMSYTQVENGHVGMQKEFGALQENPLDAGPHFIEPWASVDEVSVQVETREYLMNDNENGIGSAVSSDNQAVFMKVIVDYQLLQEKAIDIYRTIGPRFVEKKLDPAVPELTKRITAQYKAVDFAKNRGEIRTQIEELLRSEMDAVGIQINKVSLKNVDFTKALKDAIEATVANEQNAKAAEQQVKVKQAEAEQAEAVAQGEAAAAIARAKGEADATTLRARAEANKIRLEGRALAQNPQILRKLAIEKLNPAVKLIVPEDSTLVQGLDGATAVPTP